MANHLSVQNCHCVRVFRKETFCRRKILHGWHISSSVHGKLLLKKKRTFHSGQIYMLTIFTKYLWQKKLKFVLLPQQYWSSRLTYFLSEDIAWYNVKDSWTFSNLQALQVQMSDLGKYFPALLNSCLVICNVSKALVNFMVFNTIYRRFFIWRFRFWM